MKRLTLRIEGSVNKPGHYVLGGGFNLKTIFDIAGGLSNSADLLRAQLPFQK